MTTQIKTYVSEEEVRYCITEEKDGIITRFSVEVDAEDAARVTLEACKNAYEALDEDDTDYLPEWMKEGVRPSPVAVNSEDNTEGSYIGFWHNEFLFELRCATVGTLPGYEVVNMPSYSLPYFVNGDESGLSEEELENVHDMEKDENIAEIVDWAQEPTFCMYYGEMYKCIVRHA